MDCVNQELDNKIAKIASQDNVYETGKVVRVRDYIIEVKGLENIGFFEQVTIEDKAIGYVMEILYNTVIIAILKEYDKINVGDIVYGTGEEFKSYVSDFYIGKIVDIFGVDKLVGKTFDNLIKIKVENSNISLMDRISVKRPLLTGVTGIDLIYPIGKGQRQLIIGDKKTGKTQLTLDIIVNQNGKEVICIYVAIGKTKKEVKEIYSELYRRGALKYTIILVAFNDEKPTVLSLTPNVALSIAEHYLKFKYDVLVVIDDLKRHADAYREISLISGKNPGRDAYPSDIFYTHARMLEKGCQHKNGGSITIIPVVETKAGDITDYISTNIISITDGQLVLSAKNFNKGEKPAIDYGLSVSRLGGAVQEESMKKLGAVVRRELLSYMEKRDVYDLANIDEMGIELKSKIENGKKILNNLIQYKYSPKTKEEIIDSFSFINEEEK
ncbi:MAG: F0F1 ATP synthase subunit alpha [Bacilli bacterium]|nr:F0F1 ATP synthase subunit alpha [Bacilli bacterium]